VRRGHDDMPKYEGVQPQGGVGVDALGTTTEGEEMRRFGNRPTCIAPTWKDGRGGSARRGMSCIGSPPDGGCHEQGERGSPTGDCQQDHDDSGAGVLEDKGATKRCHEQELEQEVSEVREG
jgi:hypothetical protein